MTTHILFPSSFFDVRKVDEDLQQEYGAAVETGLFNIIIFGYNKWFDENKLVLTEMPDYAPALPQELAGKYATLDSPMYTVDWAELHDGTWKIIEAGDGQVSGLSDGQDYGAFFRALYYCIN